MGGRQSFWTWLWAGAKSEWRASVVTAIIVTAVFGGGLVLASPDARLLDGVAAATFLAFAAPLGLLSAYLGYREIRSQQPRERAELSLRAKVDALSRSMREAAALASEIESLLRVRQRAYDDLLHKETQLQELAKANEQAIHGYALMAASMARRQGLVWNVLGIIATIAITAIGILLSILYPPRH